MLFHTDGFYGSGTPEAMAMILRTICQGMKVCVETVLMAADGGLVETGRRSSPSRVRPGAPTRR